MKKIKTIIFWAGIFLIILTTILARPLANLDEMWNFNVARCIANGLVPYRDISMVSTPLLGFITAGFLKIFGSEMFVTRVLAAIMAMVNVVLMYRILKNIEVNRVIAKTTVAVGVMTLLEYFCLDYNFLIVSLILSIILLEIKLKKKDNKYIHAIVGVLAGLAICTKQSIGLIVSIVVLLNTFYFVRSKADIKKCLKQSLCRIIGIAIPILIFVIYLIITKSFTAFMDYAVWGLKTFSNKIEYKNLFRSNILSVSFLAAIVPVFIFAAVVENIYFKIIKEEKNMFYLLTVYSIPSFIIAFPISDNIHFLIASIVPLLLIVYSLYKVIKKAPTVKYEDKVFKYSLEFFEIVITLFIVIFLAYFEFINMDRLSNLSKYKNTNHFRYIYVDSQTSRAIKDVDNYILNQKKNVYILDATAALYMIPIDRYNKDYDMFLKGNIGSSSEQGLIERIEEENAKYLILKEEYNLNWQAPTEVITYVKENLKKSDDIGCFDIYKHHKKEIKEEQEVTSETSENPENTEESNNENAEQ